MKKKEVILFVILLVLQTIIYIFTGMNKPYLHIDEAYSFGLTNYDKIEIQDNPDFYNTWHDREYFEDYLAVQEDEKWDFKPVYENQKNDVHPPLYYLLLRIGMEFTGGHYSKWPGFILNIIAYIFITIFMYLILKELLKNDKNANIKAMVLAFVSSITLTAVSNVIYIRMYSLLTLEVLITTFLHIKLIKKEEIDLKLLILIGISVLAGVLTHYYYLFYLVPLYLVIFVKYIKEKQIKKLVYYTITMLAAGIISLIIFPYSIKHMFFGYRGQGVMENLKAADLFITGIAQQINVLNIYAFNNLLYFIVIIIIALWIYTKIRKKEKIKLEKETKNILIMICVPSIVFVLITAIASPWHVLRYVVPVCSIIFILAIYWIYKLLQKGFSEKITNIAISLLLCIILASPFIFKLKPELLYDNMKGFMEKIGGELNVPTVYFYESGKDRLFDDILTFEKLDNSYITKDMEYTEENIQKIFKGKDTSKGIIILLNQGENTDNIIDTVKNALDLEKSEYLQRLTYCDAYYVYND